MNRIAATCLLMLLTCSTAFSQASKQSHFDGSKLEPMMLTYGTTFPSNGQTVTLHGIQTIERETMDGRDVWISTAVYRTGMDVASTDVDVWDARTLESVRRKSVYNGTSFETEEANGGLNVKTTTPDGEETSQMASYDGPIVSDGSLNYVALGTLPLKEGYKGTYNSYVRRENSVQSQDIEVVGKKTIEVPAGRFDTYVVKTHLTKGGGAQATWYVMREAPHLAVKLEAVLPSGDNATVELLRVMKPGR